jgi:hypothetical protein
LRLIFGPEALSRRHRSHQGMLTSWRGSMRVPSPMRIAALTLLVGGLACAKNTPNEEVGAARDTTAAGISDSAKTNQTKQGVTDTKTGEGTVPNATQTRPDQGEPVTSKGDTLNPAVDSSAINREPTPSTTRQTVVDTAMTPQGADSSAADSSMAPDTSTTAR